MYKYISHPGYFTSGRIRPDLMIKCQWSNSHYFLTKKSYFQPIFFPDALNESDWGETELYTRDRQASLLFLVGHQRGSRWLAKQSCVWPVPAKPRVSYRGATNRPISYQVPLDPIPITWQLIRTLAGCNQGAKGSCVGPGLIGAS